MKKRDVITTKLEAQKVIGLRKTGKYQMISEMIPALFSYAGRAGLQIGGAPIFICHENCGEEACKANEDGTADLEVALPIQGELEDDAESGIASYELPGGLFAKVVHKGPYQECGKAYCALFDWIKENEHEIKGPIREYYLNDPREVAEDELLTEICAPI